MAEKAKVSFSRGQFANFQNIEKDPDTLYVITDTHEIYLGDTRYAIGDNITVSVEGDGNVVENVSWDQSTCKLTIHRGSTITEKDVKDIIDSTLGGYQFVSNDDYLLYQEQGRIKSELAITTERDQETQNLNVVLKGVNGRTISSFDASDFVKAGILKSASIEEDPISHHKLMVLTFIVDGKDETFKIDVEDLVDEYVVEEGGGLKLVGNKFSIDNDIEPCDKLNGDIAPKFGETISLNTIKYDKHGLISSKGTFKFTLPSITGHAGDVSNNKLLTYVSFDNNIMSGNTVDIVANITDSSTDGQIPTAKAVNSKIKDNSNTWETI